jgi:hypothetical protein
MPAESKAQRIAMAIAEHHPEELYERNKGLKKMTHKQLHEFASTPEKGLPEKVKKMHEGGVVPENGIYELQKGELVVPTSPAPSGPDLLPTIHSLYSNHEYSGASYKMAHKSRKNHGSKD